MRFILFVNKQLRHREAGNNLEELNVKYQDTIRTSTGFTVTITKSILVITSTINTNNITIKSTTIT